MTYEFFHEHVLNEAFRPWVAALPDIEELWPTLKQQAPVSMPSPLTGCIAISTFHHTAQAATNYSSSKVENYPNAFEVYTPTPPQNFVFSSGFDKLLHDGHKGLFIADATSSKATRCPKTLFKGWLFLPDKTA